MASHSYLLYDSPLGGQPLPEDALAPAWERVVAFLTTFTTAATPASVEVIASRSPLYDPRRDPSFAAPRADVAELERSGPLSPLARATVDALGLQAYGAWSRRTPGSPELRWTVADPAKKAEGWPSADPLRAMLRWMDALKVMPGAVHAADPPLTVDVIWKGFQLTAKGTGIKLPQQVDGTGEPLTSKLRARIQKGRNAVWFLEWVMPWPEPGAQFAAYWQLYGEALGAPLQHRRLRRRIEIGARASLEDVVWEPGRS